MSEKLWPRVHVNSPLWPAASFHPGRSHRKSNTDDFIIFFLVTFLASFPTPLLPILLLLLILCNLPTVPAALLMHTLPVSSQLYFSLTLPPLPARLLPLLPTPIPPPPPPPKGVTHSEVEHSLKVKCMHVHLRQLS